MSGQKLYTFPIHPMMFPGPPLPQTVQLVLLTKANVKENLEYFCVHLLFNQCCVPVFGKRLSLTEQEHTSSMIIPH